MITKKTKKTNTKATTKKGYNLNNIKTKKATEPKKEKSNAVNNFFSVIGFIGVVGGLMTMFMPTMAHANQGSFVTEPFSCSVTLADYRELQRVLEVTPRTDYKYKIFLSEYEAVSKVLAEHKECKGVKDGK